MFAHDFNNPPSLQGGSSIELTLINPVGAFQVKKGQVSSSTEYTISVTNPVVLGVTTDDQVTVNRACQDLTLACNIVLRQIAMNLLRLDAIKPEVGFVPTPPEVMMNEDGSIREVKIMLGGGIRSEVSFLIGAKEDLDEGRAATVARKLYTLQRFGLQGGSDLRSFNLTNALHEFEASFAALDRLSAFKHLYSTLEIITNMDGFDRKNNDLDVKMAAVTGTSVSQCSDWRNLSNRTKHIHRNVTDIATFVSGTEKVTAYNPTMRSAGGILLESLLTTL